MSDTTHDGRSRTHSPEAGRTARDTGARHQIRETGSLVGDALNQVSRLVRGEIDLFRAEIDQNIKKAVAAVGMIIAGIILTLVALNVLASAIVVALTRLGLAPGWSALVVGAAFLLVAVGLLSTGTSRLKATSLAPTRTARNVRRDGEAAKEAL